MKGFGGGGNRQIMGNGFGPDGVCICEKCGTEVPHKRGVPCYSLRCPVCGSIMTRKSGDFSGKSNYDETEEKTDSSAVKYIKPSKPKVDEFACIGCGNCVRICPFNAIELKGGIAYINSDKCRNCRRCVNICPAGAIS